jgi:hypothetical protein
MCVQQLTNLGNLRVIADEDDKFRSWRSAWRIAIRMIHRQTDLVRDIGSAALRDVEHALLVFIFQLADGKRQPISRIDTAACWR